MKKTICLLYIILAATGHTFGQITSSLKLKTADATSKQPITTARVKVNETAALPVNSLGSIIVKLTGGTNIIEISAFNYGSQTLSIDAADTAWHTIYLEAKTNQLEEVTFIASTRSNQSIENSPMKVEVLGKEEVSEEVGIKPGNIASILGDVSGVQIQQSSAVSGNSNVRIQGLPGRYTQVLRDGMPLYDGFSGGFGILTIPPLDLRQIELIKGSASTLYGGGAIAGLVNLISKRPTVTQEADVVANVTTLNEADLNGYIAKRGKKTGYTLYSGYVRQKAKDVNNDGFSDVPTSRSLLVHPKLFYYPTDKTIISVGYSGTFDDRKGGDMTVLKDGNGRGIPFTVHQFFENNMSQRHTGEYAIEQFFKNNAKLTVKGLASNFHNSINTSAYSMSAKQMSYYNEASFNEKIGKTEYVAGFNINGDNYRLENPTLAPILKFSNNTVGVFGQLSRHFRENTIVEIGARIDHHNDYGLFALPRVAVFHRIDKHFATRADYGAGYKTPNPFSQQDLDYNPLIIQPVNYSIPAVAPEKSHGLNAEGNYKTEWGKKNSLFINQAFFYTQVNDPIVYNDLSHSYIALTNAVAPLKTKGFDTYLKLTIDQWELYGGYTYTDAKRTYLPANTFVPLTSRNRLAFVLVREIEEKWRFGMEGSYFGSQYRYDATKTPDYFFMALMALYNIDKHVTVVVNCENVLNYKMSNVESLYTGPVSSPKFKPLWAPIDGRVINVSIRAKM